MKDPFSVQDCDNAFLYFLLSAFFINDEYLMAPMKCIEMEKEKKIEKETC